MWLKIDDRIPYHPKVIAAGNTAMGLWMRAAAWSMQQLTDGFVPATVVGSLAAKPSDAERLVKVGLWLAEPEGYRFHDWFDYQPSAHDVRQRHEERGNTGRRGNHLRWHVRTGKPDADCPFCRAEGIAR